MTSDHKKREKEKEILHNKEIPEIEERVKMLVAARKDIYEDVIALSKLQIPLGDYVQPPHNRTAFWYSCRNGNLKIARIILKKGSNINHKDVNGISPLHICSKYGHTHIAKFLIENNADINIKDNVRMKKLYSKNWRFNRSMGNISAHIVKLLIESGVDVKMKDQVILNLVARNEIIVKDSKGALNID
ncbi:ankyrin-repeat protein [Plasmodium brasilianum]|uniref:Ankyrin-repeat protein n=1 Tax=Plasmodium brasilianum TaxID=5824 RepID=A0ACB9YB98_PLABR|nr:ankyrin-repeat protein [Plasmodium brasilianum]